jgi:multiple sugar transport system permease protein
MQVDERRTRPSSTGQTGRRWPRRVSTLSQRERWMALSFLLPAVVLVAVLIYLPIGRVIWSSLTAQVPLRPERELIGLDRYGALLGDSAFWAVVRNSLVWTGGVVLLQNAAGLTVALLLDQNLPFRRLTRSVVLVPWVLPGVAAALLWRFMYDPQLGLFNALLTAGGGVERGVPWLADQSTAMAAVVVAAVWKGFPFSMVMYLAALQGVQQDQLEAARVDGAGALARFRYVVVPSIAGLIRLNLLLTTIFTFNYFDMIWVMTRGGPLGATHIFPTYIFRLGFGELQFEVAAAYGVVAALLLAVIGYLYIRALRPGESL